MRIIIEYPYVLKMQVKTEIEISKSPSLEEVQKKIFNGFWQTFIKLDTQINKHGSWLDVNIADGSFIISDSKTLEERLKRTNSFQVVFTNRHERGNQ